ncbi:MAG: hypothetical protein JNM27_19725 [Leptospirales bacterium]|nr:hypothetical protein [Leptospirales bacterium]
MKQTLMILMAVSMLGFAACGKKAASTDGGCEGISAMDAKMKCEDNKVMFCSSFTTYKWQAQNACEAGKTCFISEDGKSGGCK